MGITDTTAALAVVKTTYDPIHDIGTAIYLSPDVMGWAAEWGWSNPFSFYFAGRGGMLGDVGSDVVTSALGWFEPNAVKAMYTEGVGVAPAKEAAARMAEAHSKWGRKHYADVDDGAEGLGPARSRVGRGLLDRVHDRIEAGGGLVARLHGEDLGHGGHRMLRLLPLTSHHPPNHHAERRLRSVSSQPPRSTSGKAMPGRGPRRIRGPERRGPQRQSLIPSAARPPVA